MALPHLYLPRSPKPLLLLDQDGPMASFDDRAWEVGMENGMAFDIDGVHEQTKRYLSDHLPDEGERRALRDICESSGWFLSLPVVPGAQEGVEALIDAGVDVWVCTKPMEGNPTCRDEKQMWIDKHFPVLSKRMFTAPNKGMVVGDVLLDDAPMTEWFDYACWAPVIYECGYNGGGSDWSEIPRFSWDRPIEDLIVHLDKARSAA